MSAGRRHPLTTCFARAYAISWGCLPIESMRFCVRERWVKRMRRITVLSAIVGSMIVLVVGCTSSSSQGSSSQGSSSQEEKAYAPHINPADFTTTIDNEYFPPPARHHFRLRGGRRA